MVVLSVPVGFIPGPLGIRGLRHKRFAKRAQVFRRRSGRYFAPSVHEPRHTILAQMGGKNLQAPGIIKPYAIAGKHNEGGLLIELDQAIAKDRGTFFVVSYDYGQDLYTVHYFRKVSDSPQGFDLLYEAEGIFCDSLCELFTEKTGIEIPPIEFGSFIIIDPEE